MPTGAGSVEALDETQEDAPQVTGAVAGRVTDSSGQPLAGVTVVVRTAPFHPVSSGFGTRVHPGPTWQGTTDDDGRYRIADVTAGAHRVQFSRRGHADVHNGGALTVESAPDVRVQGDSAATADAVMHRGGRIRGTVTGTDGQPPGRSQTVEAGLAGRRAWVPLATAATDRRGNYRLDRLPPGRYQVRVNHLRSGTVHHPSATRRRLAAAVSLEEGARLQDVDVVVPPPAVVTGRVLSRQGRPLAGVLVQAHQGIQDMGRYGSMPIGLEQVRTDRFGRYRLTAPTSRLTLWAEAGSSDHCDIRTVRVEGLGVTAGATYVRDLQVPKPSVVTGRVTDTEGRPLRGIPVVARQTDLVCAVETRTDARGRYVLRPLRAGAHRVEFAPRLHGRRHGFFPQEYGGDERPESGTVLRLRAGRSVRGVDGILTLGGRVTGRVSLPEGVDPAEVTVVAREVADPDQGYQEEVGKVRPDGTFAVVGLSAGTFRLRFSADLTYDSNLDSLTPRFRVAGSGSTVEFHEVEVELGQETAGVDVVLDVGASISGTVTVVTNGEPQSPQGIEVVAHRWGTTIPGEQGWLHAGGASVDDDGRWTIRGLSAGTYRIGFASGTEFYPDATTLEDAQDIEVDSDEAVGGIDAEVNFTYEVSP